MTGLTRKVQKEVEIDAPAEKFYKLWKSECFHLRTASPSNIQGVEVHEGDWETGGSIKIWKYTVEGRAETFKKKVEADDEQMMGSGSVATVSIEYEKRNKDVPDPVAYVDFMASMNRDVASHIMKA
ncbi:hypothetical protein Patl1_15428 [Pistacia atlantica]|uniref:Uncharacterized protein n=1 Tax=Pistacia atlantica TaxID=434234 RepID=A0ACC1BA49_9ROSI|nr:hypothetical protein Patl1_15428 [Pistacia atlantica]